MKRWTMGLLALMVTLAVAAPAFAQGGGASSTGTIQGRVADAQGAVLPGVTVTATSPSMLGPQTVVTSETGNYRFPAVPPGTYTVTYELPGFNTLKREGIQITLGFTATVNIEMSLATLEETVTVTGESPVIDTTATRVQQNFKVEQLQSIPNGRDMWSLLAVTPAVQMARIDVGGNRAGTQTGYTAYGFTGQVRVLIEGINTTEGTGGAGFYFDYSSLEEVFLGTTGQGAEMPNPGVQSQFIAKSGGNQFSGEYYLDWYNNALQGSNIPQDVIDRGIREHSNEIDRYYDTAINVGGPIKKDKIWWFGTYRTQFNAVQQPNFSGSLAGKTFDTKLWNPVAKVTYQVNQNNKIIGYYQWGQKVQASRLPFGTYTYTDIAQTNKQDSGSWVYKGEWNGTLSDKLYLEARFGDFGYYFPQTANGDAGYFWRDSGLEVLEGSHQRWQLDRDRKQVTAAATYFLDTGKGSHTIKFGGEVLKEKSWEGYWERYGGNQDLVYANGRSSSVTFAIPTSTCETGSLSAHDCLLSKAALDVAAGFVNDTWAFGRATINAGVRWDRYHGWNPAQEQLAGTNGPVSVAAETFAERDVFTWNSFAPRVGFVYDFSGVGRSVLKVNYGLFWHNPGAAVAADSNPNQASKTETYVWNDLNGDKRFQMGEQGNRTASALAGAVSVDPNLKQPYTHEAGAFFEQQITDVLGARVGFVYKTEDDLFGTFTPNRSALNGAYSVPFDFVDVGVDGVRGTADDKTITLYGMPSGLAANFPVNQVVMTVPDRLSRYKTIEASVNKRFSNRWSAQIGGAYTMMHDFPETVANSYPQTPDRPGVADRTVWNFKATGSYDAAYGIRISPVLRHQSGTNFARTISVPGTAGNAFGLVFPASTIYADAADANREDNIWVFDVRAEKTVNFGSRSRVRLFLDVFNLANSSSSETITRSTGANYLRPSAILAPRTARLGFRFLW
ncbi:MAG: carboxypeptidase regulatory-like domain-containing protein [Vicinamibacterales bacterium]